MDTQIIAQLADPRTMWRKAALARLMLAIDSGAPIPSQIDFYPEHAIRSAHILYRHEGYADVHAAAAEMAEALGLTEYRPHPDANQENWNAWAGDGSLWTVAAYFPAPKPAGEVQS